MVTVFSIPKAMRGHIGVIQRNALESWRRLPGVEVLLLGDDPGVAEVAAELGFRHIPTVARTAAGTPRIDDLFARAEDAARGEMVVYVNADIILMEDFLAALRHPAPAPALRVCGRWNIEQQERLDFAAGWESRLRARVAAEGEFAGFAAIDAFAFPRGLFGAIPAFAIGRHHWDNWLVFRARSRGAAVIDLSPAALAVHQNHGYGAAEALNDAQLRETPEVARNRALAGGAHIGLTLAHATHRLTPSGLRRGLQGTAGGVSRLACHPGLFRAAAWAVRGLERSVPEVLKARLRGRASSAAGTAPPPHRR